MNPKIEYILVGSRKRVGKDTLARILVDEINLSTRDRADRFAFAYELKEQLCDKLPGLDFFSEDPELKEKVLRPLLVAWGMARRHQNENYWADLLAETVEYEASVQSFFKERGMKTFYAVISDWRFPNELLRLQELGFTCHAIHVDRPLFPAEIAEEKINDPLCSALAGYHVYNAGGIDNLKDFAKSFVKTVVV